ncbi:hypothetical protein MTO96_029595 [Rhipicephalus appendiculatus]
MMIGVLTVYFPVPALLHRFQWGSNTVYSTTSWSLRVRYLQRHLASEHGITVRECVNVCFHLRCVTTGSTVWPHVQCRHHQYSLSLLVLASCVLGARRSFSRPATFTNIYAGTRCRTWCLLLPRNHLQCLWLRRFRIQSFAPLLRPLSLLFLARLFQTSSRRDLPPPPTSAVPDETTLGHRITPTTISAACASRVPSSAPTDLGRVSPAISDESHDVPVQPPDMASPPDHSALLVESTRV